jgi:endonuclease YncB( thermonuclease family)
MVLTFAIGVVTGATIESAPTASIRTALDAGRVQAPRSQAPPSDVAAMPRLDPKPAPLRLAYPAEVLRVIDGDTFEARVRVWPGLDVDTKVRLRGIDAAELHARCSDEHLKAEAARTALVTILAEGGVALSNVGIDKYGGRVDALASTQNTAVVSAAMLNGGWARRYDGSRRGSWCASATSFRPSDP